VQHDTSFQLMHKAGINGTEDNRVTGQFQINSEYQCRVSEQNLSNI